MLKKCGSSCFLLPNQKSPGNSKFPICANGSCRKDCKGILSALIRAKQWEHKHPSYKKAASKAKSLYSKHKCSHNKSKAKSRRRSKRRSRAKSRRRSRAKSRRRSKAKSRRRSRAKSRRRSKRRSRRHSKGKTRRKYKANNDEIPGIEIIDEVVDEAAQPINGGLQILVNDDDDDDMLAPGVVWFEEEEDPVPLPPLPEPRMRRPFPGRRRGHRQAPTMSSARRQR